VRVALHIAVTLSLCTFALTCDKATDPPPPGEQPLTFKALDASCTEAWLEVKFHPDAQLRTIEIKRDTVPILATTLTGTDTLIVDEGLLPTREYTYTLRRPGVPFAQPLTATITTMDTTSHDGWTWQIDTLGVTSSVLYDCAVISEDNIWAVGELFLNDSSGNLDPILYNAVHWDGTRWNIMRIPYIYQGQTFYGALRAVYAFNTNDVWFGSGNMIHWNGQSFASVELPAGVWGPYLMNKIWGHDGELYVVGNSGAIAHRNATGTWRRVESGVGLPIMDVYGARDSETGEYEILCVAEQISPGGSKVLAIEGNGVRELDTPGLLSWGIWGTWFIPNRHYMVVGSGVWRSRLPEGTWALDDSLPRLFSTSIDGQALNDAVVCGAFWLLATWNGVRWQTYFPRTSGSFGGVAIKGNLIVAVGDFGNRAVVAKGRR
jgi:hypothetical protein